MLQKYCKPGEKKRAINLLPRFSPGLLRYVAVAHHREDNTETFFLNLVRGAGLHGLTGMKPKTANVIRPLLASSREEIERYLIEKEETYVTDRSNYDTIYRRNKLRQQILPLLREMNPSFDETLAKTMQTLIEADTLVADETANYLRAHRLSSHFVETWRAADLLSHPAPHTLLHALLSPYGFTSAQETEIFEALQRTEGQIFHSPRYSVCLYRACLQLSPTPKKIVRTSIKEGTNVLPDGREINVEILEKREISRNSSVATLDADKIRGNLCVRTPETGDRFTPFGMRGSKLVSDYLTNCHRSRLERAAALLLCDAAGPLWLVGERIDARAAVTPRTTRVLKITLCEA